MEGRDRGLELVGPRRFHRTRPLEDRDRVLDGSAVPEPPVLVGQENQVARGIETGGRPGEVNTYGRADWPPSPAISGYMGISRQLTLRLVNAAAFSEIYSVLGLLRRQKALLRQGG